MFHVKHRSRFFFYMFHVKHKFFHKEKSNY